ncbi:carbohydrate ABC transporter permease [Dactylosporangium matsuzakiense]|uniref:Sugar ABC transporter permease n=1 Tax=Dactylosporangium matsuzakiense TaxID=53360 RepID=A0A9W6KMT6_9ACTN|nr:carbohydrate ABC transporter permease [Dactylosporangium matsuzakiense]GLL03780.1 sugar ABC transporter permease [Dactylosporangium matsuzakiense]
MTDLGMPPVMDRRGRSGTPPRGTGAAGDPPPRRTTVTSPVRTAAKHAGLILLTVVMLYPVLWMVVSSLRPNDVIFRSPGLVLTDLTAHNYGEGWNALASPFGHYLVNSAVVVLGCIIGNLVSCSMAAYAFARLEFTGKRLWFALMLGSIMLPIHVLIVPQYIMFAQVGWINTFLPLIVPKLLATDAFFVFLMVQFIRGLPRELDEAARIDGAGHPRIFLQIILPLMRPALATTTIFTFIWTWNDFFSQLIYLTDPDMYTVPVALRSFVDATVNTSWGAMFAMSVLSLLPVFLVFLVGQRYLVQGIATTGSK